jgi:hypothetical protein
LNRGRFNLPLFLLVRVKRRKVNMEDNKQIKVKNRVNSTVVYIIPDMGNLRREFQAQEEKILTFEELRKLSYTPGGDVLLRDYLVIKDN